MNERIFFTEFLNRVTQIQRVGNTFPKELEKISSEYCAGAQRLYVLNLVGTRQVAGARRGARVKSIALAFRKPWVHIFKPVLMLALDDFFKTPTIDVIAKVYNSLYTLDLPSLPELSFYEKKVVRSFMRNKVPHFDNDLTSKLSSVEDYDETGFL